MSFYGKKGLIFISIMIILSAWAYADSAAPDYYQYRVRYSSGDIAKGWTTQCNTNPSSDSDDWSSGYSCSVSGLGTSSSPVWCSEENTVQVQWRMYHEPDGGASYVYTTTGWEDMYTINWDGDPNDCVCHGDVWAAGKCCGDDGASDDYCAGGFTACVDGSYLTNGDTSQQVCVCGGGTYGASIGFESGTSSACCGDDASEYYKTEQGAVDGSNSDHCCNSANDCVDDDTCYSEAACHNTGSSVSFNEYCDAGTWHNDDDSSTFCNACVGAGRYNIGGDVGQCCGDDANENRITEMGATDGSNSDACCNAVDKCVDDNTCYPSNSGAASCHDTGSSASTDEYCDTNTWHDDDDAQNYCDACVGVGRYNIGGEIGSCCGDDPSENVLWEAGDTDGVNSNACCNSGSDCVDDNTCYSSGSCTDTGSTLSNWPPNNREYCNAGTWEEEDRSAAACAACGTGDWDMNGADNEPGINGDTNCCGDDANEYKISEAGSVDSTPSDACCNAADKCVDDNTCYANATCHDTGSGGSLTEFCNDGTWMDDDTGQTYCNACTGAGHWDVGFEAGTNATCCGDDPGENYVVEQGCAAGDCVDANSSDHCCNAATDCVDDDSCYSQGACHDTGGTASVDEYCTAGTWIDDDDSKASCDACVGPGNWNISFGAGTEGLCCGDDAPYEYHLNESSSTLYDLVDSQACCNSTISCVDDGQCYVDESQHDIGENEPSISAQTFDREICDGDTSHGYGDNNDWHDADENENFCSMARTPTTEPDQALSCQPLGDCWVAEGESGGPFGGYSAGNNIQGCCGDDSGESYIFTDYYNFACCDDPGDFVAYNRSCQAASDRVYLYGRVMGQIPNGSYVPLYHALIQAVDPVYGLLVNQNYTDHNGYYNISGVKGIKYSLELRPSASYNGKTVHLDIINVDTRTDFNITLLSSCMEDCTSFNSDDNKFYCDKNCDGINGCTYNASIVSDYPEYPPSSTMKDLCNDLSPGWTVYHNSTDDIQCCNKGYVKKPQYRTAVVDLGSNYSHVDSYYGGMVSYYGKFLSVWVAMGEN